jgi:hypothetical protein
MLKIDNLSNEIDMTAVRGGDSGTALTNEIVQGQNICVPVATDGSGGPTNTHVTVNASQNACIWNDIRNGDLFRIAFPA